MAEEMRSRKPSDAEIEAMKNVQKKAEQERLERLRQKEQAEREAISR